MEAVVEGGHSLVKPGEQNGGPLVSVIVIFYNASRFLQEAIESVLAQAYQDWELLLVDDGSTDVSAAIAKGFAKQIPEKVRYLQHANHGNRGKSASRNLGIQCSNGVYIAFLDADDVWLPNKLQQQVAILEARPEAGMVYCLSEYWYRWEEDSSDAPADFVHALGVSANSLIRPPDLFNPFFLQQKAAIPNPTSILIRREVVEKLGGFEEVFHGVFNIYEDQAFLAKVILATPVIAAAEVWDRYRQHPDSSCSAAARDGTEFKARLFFLEWLVDYISRNPSSESVQRKDVRLLRKEILMFKHPLLHRLRSQRKRIAIPFMSLALQLGWRVIPPRVRDWLLARRYGRDYRPPLGWVRFGSLRRVTPFSREFGYDRGLPIDRYYIEKFLSLYQEDVRGSVLEIADNYYTNKFGGNQVLQSDVLHVALGAENATIIADLTRADSIPSNSFDCIIITQTLQMIYDVSAALRTLYRILKPGGVLIATVPGISPISRYDMDRWGYYWSFTSLSAKRLLGKFFPENYIEIHTYGNVLTATAFLYGMASEELRLEEMDFRDPDYEVIVAIRAIKPVGQG